MDATLYEWRPFFFIARKEIKRLRSRHLISPERIRNKITSDEVTTAAKADGFCE